MLTKPFKAAIAGCGGIFPMHARALQTLGVEISAVCDSREERAESKAHEWGCAFFTDFKEMIQTGGFDVLHICLPHYLHPIAALEAMAAGKHVLTEKPMAIHLADAERMVAAAKENGVTLGVIFQNRFNPACVLIKETLDSGALGKIVAGLIRVTWHRDGAYYTESGWRGNWATEGGGVIINQSIHSFDQMNWFINDEPLSVDVSATNRAHPMIEVEDVAEGVITYHNGATVSFYVNTYHSYDAPISLEIHCEKGKIQMTGEEVVIRFNDGKVLNAGRDEKAQTVFGQKDYWGVSHIKQIQNYYEALAAGVQPGITGESALKTQKLICAIYDSALSRKKVNL